MEDLERSLGKLVDKLGQLAENLSPEIVEQVGFALRLEALSELLGPVVLAAFFFLLSYFLIGLVSRWREKYQKQIADADEDRKRSLELDRDFVSTGGSVGVAICFAVAVFSLMIAIYRWFAEPYLLAAVFDPKVAIAARALGLF